MTLWKRAPRQVYRVYGEDEYLGEGDDSTYESFAPTPLDRNHDQDIAPKSSLSRLIVLSLLLSVAIGAVGLIVLNAVHKRRAISNRGSMRANVTNDTSPVIYKKTGEARQAPPLANHAFQSSPVPKTQRQALMGMPTGHSYESVVLRPSQVFSHGASGSNTAVRMFDREFSFER